MGKNGNWNKVPEKHKRIFAVVPENVFIKLKIFCFYNDKTMKDLVRTILEGFAKELDKEGSC